MRGTGSESPMTASRPQSRTSSKFRLHTSSKARKTTAKSVMPMFLQQRQTMRVVENNIDMTPKPLTHHMFSPIEDGQMTAFEAIGLSQGESVAHLAVASSVYSTYKSSSTMLMRSSFFRTEGVQMESLLSTQALITLDDDDDERAPPHFYLPSHDPAVFYVRPETVKITLKETETFFIFEMLQLSSDLETLEGVQVKAENERYEEMLQAHVSLRKLTDAESQTKQILTKSRGTHPTRITRRNNGMFVNNWVMHDTYAQPELMQEVNNLLVVHTPESLHRFRASQEDSYKLPKQERSSVLDPDEQLAHIGRLGSFKNAVRIMERIIANNVFIDVQKRFTGLVKQDPCSLDLEFTYTPDLLWTFDYCETHGRPVAAFRWNPANVTIVAVAYGPKPDSVTKDGILLVWCAKNPSQPGRIHHFNSPISDIAWSRDKPNLLAVGYYDGAVKVLDVSRKELNVMRQSRRATALANTPHWQVQWWGGDEQFAYKEQIYTCCQDGRIFCYRSGEDFTSSRIMTISRMEGKLPGVNRTNHCVIYDIPISRHPAALVLRKHPTLQQIYFVCSEEGCVYRCSTTYLYQHIESFIAHDGPIYSMEFSPFCPKIFLTCGADWCTRIWLEGLTEPLITLTTTMACVRCATWCPTYSTIIASIVNNEICIWDIKRKTYTPTSVMISPNSARLVMVDFSANGNQLVVADVEGTVYVYNLEGMPFPPYNQKQVLIDSVEKALITKPALLMKVKKEEL